MIKIIKAILLSLIIVLVLYYTGYIIVSKAGVSNFRQFYKEKENIDVLFIGPSTIYYVISPMYIWDKYGIVTYNRGTQSQTYALSYSLLEESLKKEKPSLIVLDISLLAILEHNKHINNAVMNQIASPLLRNKTRLLYNDNISALNIFNLYHDRIFNLSEADFFTKSFYKGELEYSICYYDPNLKDMDDSSSIELDKIVVEYTNKYIELAKKYNADILFTCMPSLSDRQKYYREFSKLAYTLNVPYLNYSDKSLSNIIGIDYKHDFIDPFHINIYGARKIMDHLIPYIIEHYNIPNRKDDPKYASWNEDYIKYARAVNREEIRARNSFNEWQNLAYYDNYTMLISTNGDNVLNRLPQTMKDRFKSLGLTKYETVQGNLKYAAIIDNNQVFFEEVTDNIVSYNGRMKNIVNLMVSSEPWKATINVSGKPRAKNRYGINFVIYDKVNREIVDSIWIDPAQPDVVRR